jgi:hypothetical protein
MSSMLGPRFAWLGFLLAFAALCAVITGFTEIVRPRLKDLRVPSLSVAFASLNALGYVAVFIAFPVVTPMLGGLSASAHGHRPDGPDNGLRRLAANSPLSTIRQAATGY